MTKRAASGRKAGRRAGGGRPVPAGHLRREEGGPDGDSRFDLVGQDERVEEARAYLAGRMPFSASISLTLGSGLGSVRDAFQTVRAFPYAEIPHFPISTVAGHRGELVLARRGTRRLIILDGRVHCYEGYSWNQVTFAVRVLHALGVTATILTNASGAVSPRFRPGDIMLISDHIDLIWKGVAGIAQGPLVMRRPYYSRRMTELAAEVARAKGLPAKKGVLLATAGPAYETRQEVEFARKIGADSVTMSTVPEAIVCHELGISVVGLSLVTNVAASHEGGHAKVIGFAEKASRNLKELILGVLEAI